MDTRECCTARIIRKRVCSATWPLVLVTGLAGLLAWSAVSQSGSLEGERCEFPCVDSVVVVEGVVTSVVPKEHAGWYASHIRVAIDRVFVGQIGHETSFVGHNAAVRVSEKSFTGTTVGTVEPWFVAGDTVFLVLASIENFSDHVRIKEMYSADPFVIGYARFIRVAPEDGKKYACDELDYRRAFGNPAVHDIERLRAIERPGVREPLEDVIARAVE